ncbi:basic salivary proline-rich protein 4-like [Molothrus aeneus]|uniref:basic salivary proline-rich protein 4-like n=1 Tax=Molothrus aeneus TaxID=84833 RepID=UPI00345799A7
MGQNSIPRATGATARVTGDAHGTGSTKMVPGHGPWHSEGRGHGGGSWMWLPCHGGSGGGHPAGLDTLTPGLPPWERPGPDPPGPEGRTYLRCSESCLRSAPGPTGGVTVGLGGTDGRGTPPPPGTRSPRGGPRRRPQPRRSHKWRGAAAAAALARPGDPPCGSQLAQVPRKVEPGPGRGGGGRAHLGPPPLPRTPPPGPPRRGRSCRPCPPFPLRAAPGVMAGPPQGWARSGGSWTGGAAPPLHRCPRSVGRRRCPPIPAASGRLRPAAAAAGRARARLSPDRRFLPLGGAFL